MGNNFIYYIVLFFFFVFLLGGGGSILFLFVLLFCTYVSLMSCSLLYFLEGMRAGLPKFVPVNPVNLRDIESASFNKVKRCLSRCWRRRRVWLIRQEEKRNSLQSYKSYLYLLYIVSTNHIKVNFRTLLFWLDLLKFKNCVGFSFVVYFWKT